MINEILLKQKELLELYREYYNLHNASFVEWGKMLEIRKKIKELDQWLMKNY